MRKHNDIPITEDEYKIELIKWKVVLLAQYESLRAYNNIIHTESKPFKQLI